MPHASDARALSLLEQERYCRQLRLPQIGEAGQRRLKQARALVVGGGGLGGPAAAALVGAGVGQVDLVDFDTVARSNLHRQLWYADADVGRSKVHRLRERLAEQNPDVRVTAFERAVSAADAPGLIAACDVVLDCSDNFPTRYALADACWLAGVPLVQASVYRFEGRLTAFVPGAGPCFRCLFPHPPRGAGACADAGVHGPLPMVLGGLQASEALKLLLGVGEPLAGRLVVLDALTLATMALATPTDPGCPLCGPAADPTRLADAAALGAPGPKDSEDADDWEATPAEALRQADGIWLDVREVPGPTGVDGRVEHLPLSRLPAALATLAPEATYLVVCDGGEASLQAVRLLRAAGLREARSLRGGLAALRRELARR